MSAAPRIHTRDVPPRTVFALEQAGVHPLLARLFAARGVRSADELDDAMAQLLPPSTLRGSAEAARLLADAIAANQRIVVVADYDCDGATACAVALRGLQMLGASSARLSYVVPDRQLHGYGLTPTIVDLACGDDTSEARDASARPQPPGGGERSERGRHLPDLLVTVDNGIASLAGVAHARSRGIAVLVTDHHLPALVDERVVLPDANVIVNPNQPDCTFASKALAGVGVMFYTLLATRAELRARGRFDAASQPRLDALLDLVALGTVADVVKLDANNRRLVAQGLKRIRAGRMQAGIAALFHVAGRKHERASAFDFGFALGPRLNAAGRLADMTLGIECLLTDDPTRAAELAAELDRINRERRDVEAGMREQAEALMEQIMPAGAPPAALALFHEGFHEGVVGIVAGRMKDRLHRPTFVFAVGADGYLKGSGRSIPGFHLRDALDLVSKHAPTLIDKFGGHAMAAGLSLRAESFDAFAAAFEEVGRSWLTGAQLERIVETDGPLEEAYFTTDFIDTLDAQVWGQGFAPPVFCDEFQVLSQRVLKEKHLKLQLEKHGRKYDAIWFGHADSLPARAQVAYRLDANEYNGVTRVQLMVEFARGV